MSASNVSIAATDGTAVIIAKDPKRYYLSIKNLSSTGTIYVAFDEDGADLAGDVIGPEETRIFFDPSGRGLFNAELRGYASEALSLAITSLAL